jgi:hypothetical protein
VAINPVIEHNTKLRRRWTGRRLPSLQNLRNAFITLWLCSFFPAVAASVERWGVFEVTLKGPTNGNPFTDVRFSAQFTQGTNFVQANGFYDGDGIYRVRFMPETQGQWKYKTASSATELDGKTGSLNAGKPSRQNHGPVRVARTYHFAYADGREYEELGTTCYVWELQPEALQKQTLKTLAASPFNKIRFCVFPKHYAYNTNEPDMYPFPGEMPARDWDFTRFNPKYFQRLEQRVEDLQKLGIEADIILFHPYDEGHWGFDRMPADADDRYLRYVVARLSAYRNVWWSLANEWDFMRQKKESDFARFGELISREDQAHHLISIHQGANYFDHSLPWISHASIQNGGAVTEPARAGFFRDKYQKPVVYDEVQYEGNIPEGWGRLKPEELVFRFWNATVAGAYCGHGETYRSDDQILWWSKGGVRKGQSPARLAFLKKVLDSAPAEGIEPVDKTHPEYGGQPGKFYLVYLGKQTPTNWDFHIPKPPSDQPQLADGMKFTAEVLDTWNMTVTHLPGKFTLKQKDGSFYADANGRSVPLPGKPYIAIRIKRVGG